VGFAQDSLLGAILFVEEITLETKMQKAGM